MYVYVYFLSKICKTYTICEIVIAYQDMFLNKNLQYNFRQFKFASEETKYKAE